MIKFPKFEGFPVGHFTSMKAVPSNIPKSQGSQAQEITLLMFGPTGAGKSTAGNRFLQQRAFVASGRGRSVTTEAIACQSIIVSVNGISYLAEAAEPPASPDGPSPQTRIEFAHRVIDTPGVGDTGGREWEHIDQTIKFIATEETGVNLIALLVAANSRFTTDFQLMFKMLHVAFGNQAQFWDHTALVFTQSYFDGRQRWEPNAEANAADWKSELCKLGRECTGDPTWNYDPPVFFIDSDFELIPTPDDEQRLWADPHVQEWWRSSVSVDRVLPFRGWKPIPIEDARLHSIFDYTLLQEWARSRDRISTAGLQVPKREWFLVKPTSEQRIVEERNDRFEDTQEEEIYFEPGTRTEEVTEYEDVTEYRDETVIEDTLVDEQVTETKPVTVKETVEVKSTKTVEKTKVQVRQVPRYIYHSGGCFSSSWTETVYDTVHEVVRYNEQVPCVETVVRDVVKLVSETRTIQRIVPVSRVKSVPFQGKTPVRRTLTRDVQVRCTRMKPVRRFLGTEVRTVQVTRHGQQFLGWEVGAQWSEPVWDEAKTERVVLTETFERA
jgi:hypothetical protein